MGKRTVALISTLALAGLLLAACAPAAPPPAPTPIPAAKAAAPTATPKPEKVVLAIPAQGFPDLFTVVAQRKGFYREEGFEVDKQVVKSDVAVKAVIAGEIEYTRAIGSALRAATLGQPIKGILAAQTRPPFVVVSRPDLKAVPDLKGKSVGVDSVQGTTHVLLKAVLKSFGMDPEKDVVAIALGDNPTRLKAVQGGAIQGAVLDMAFGIQAEGLGLKVLANVADYTERISGGLATSDKRIKENPDQVLRFVRAHVKAMKYITDPKNKDEIIAIIVDELKSTKEEALKTYELGVKGYSQDGIISEEAVKIDIDESKELGGITKDVPVSQVFDYTFVKKVKESMGR